MSQYNLGLGNKLVLKYKGFFLSSAQIWLSQIQFTDNHFTFPFTKYSEEEDKVVV